jgi:hypothetical protein
MLGAGWTRAGGGTWGELQTRELLAAAGGGGAGEAAAGWGGDRWELWRSGDASALVMRWTWDTPRDAREFAARLRRWTRDGDARAATAVAVGRGGSVTLGLAEDPALARRISSAA